MLRCMYLLDLLCLQQVTGFSEVGFEALGLQLSFDGRALLGVHLFLGCNLKVQMPVSGPFMTGLLTI